MVQDSEHWPWPFRSIRPFTRMNIFPRTSTEPDQKTESLSLDAGCLVALERALRRDRPRGVGGPFRIHSNATAISAPANGPTR